MLTICYGNIQPHGFHPTKDLINQYGASIQGGLQFTHGRYFLKSQIDVYMP